MSHGITRNDKMVFVNQLPWHGLGTRFETLLDGKQVVENAFPWTVSCQPALFRKRDGSISAVDGRFITVRDDIELGFGTVGKIYQPFQNADILDCLEPLGFRYETAGSLYEGRKCWALAPLGVDSAIRRLDGSVDREAAYVAAFWSHDGSGSILVKLTSVRVVCANTRQIALADGKLALARVIHTASAKDRLKDAMKLLAEAPNVLRADAEVMTELAQARMDRAEFVAFAGAVLRDIEAEGRADAKEKLAEDLDQATSISRARLETQIGELIEYFERGTGNRGETRYDALNAITEWVDHKRIEGRTAAEKLARTYRAADSAMEGTGAARKQRAVRLLTRW